MGSDKRIRTIKSFPFEPYFQTAIVISFFKRVLFEGIIGTMIPYFYGAGTVITFGNSASK